MKKYLLLLTIAVFLVCSSLQAQYNQNMTSVFENEVPTAVKQMHIQQYPAAFNTKWQVKNVKYLNIDQVIYVVNFKMYGRQGHKAFYNEDEGFMAYVGFVNSRDLPENIQIKGIEYVEDDFIKYGQIIQLEEPYIFLYRLKVNNTGQLQYFYFDKYGNKIAKENLAPQIFAYI